MTIEADLYQSVDWTNRFVCSNVSYPVDIAASV